MTEMKKYEMTILCAPKDSHAFSLPQLLDSIRVVFALRGWAFVPPTIREYKSGEVIRDRKPRMRDRFNPLYYIRKELQKMSDTFTQATDRIEQKIAEVNANVEALKTNVASEAAQFAVVVEELRGMSTNENLTAAQSGRLGALADKLDASAKSIQAAAEGVKGIVPDAPAGNPPAVALKFDTLKQDIVAGTGFEVKVTALDAQGNPAKDYAGTLHFSSSPANAGDVMPVDAVFGTDKPTVLFAVAGTYVLSVIDAGNPNIAMDSLTVIVS